MNSARAIRIVRAALNITQDELARRLGLHESAISRHEGGSRKPSVDQLELVAKIIDIPLNVLFALGAETENGGFVDTGKEFLRWLVRLDKPRIVSVDPMADAQTDCEAFERLKAALPPRQEGAD